MRAFNAILVTLFSKGSGGADVATRRHTGLQVDENSKRDDGHADYETEKKLFHRANVPFLREWRVDRSTLNLHPTAKCQHPKM